MPLPVENFHPLKTFQPSRRLALKNCASGVLLCTMGFEQAAWAAQPQPPLALSTALNRAGRLRGLSQRIPKAYTQLVLELMPDRSTEILTTAQTLLKTILVELGRAGFVGETAALLKTCTTDAENLLAQVTGKPTVAKLTTLNNVAEQMLSNADRLTGGIESTEARGKANAKIINIAGRQRMLSQRIAKSFMLIEAGQDPTMLSKQLEAARAEFSTAMSTLEAAPVSSPAIKQDLMLAHAQWMFYQKALDAKDKPTARRDVATTSERILEVMDSLTGLYDAALKEHLGSVASNEYRYATLRQPLA